MFFIIVQLASRFFSKLRRSLLKIPAGLEFTVADYHLLQKIAQSIRFKLSLDLFLKLGNILGGLNWFESLCLARLFQSVSVNYLIVFIGQF
jgi:hypothetical protein